MYQRGRTYNKQSRHRHIHVYNIKKTTFINVFTGLNRKVLSIRNVISLWFSLTQNQCLSVVLHMKMVFHEKAAHSAHKCFPLRHCSSFALFPVSFQFYWDGSDIQRCVSWRSTARWLGLHMLWNDHCGKVKGAPTSRNALCALLTTPQGTLMCIPGLRFNTLMNFTVLLRIFLSDSGIKKNQKPASEE